MSGCGEGADSTYFVVCVRGGASEAQCVDVDDCANTALNQSVSSAVSGGNCASLGASVVVFCVHAI